MDKRKVAVLFLILALISLLVLYKQRNNLYITQVNRNLSIGEIKLLIKEEAIKDVLEQQFIVRPGFGGKYYYSEKDGIEITFSGFPDVIDKYVLTRIETTNPEYSVFDICVGEYIDKAVQVLKSNGFGKLENAGQYVYKKGVVTITLYANTKGYVEKIFISLSSTNKDNVVF